MSTLFGYVGGKRNLNFFFISSTFIMKQFHMGMNSLVIESCVWSPLNLKTIKNFHMYILNKLT